MTDEAIKRAAEATFDQTPEFTKEEKYIAKVAYFMGAKWRSNSVWHNMNEKPNGMFVILADFGQEEYSFGLTLDGIESAKRWAYVSDLLPDRKEVQP